MRKSRENNISNREYIKKYALPSTLENLKIITAELGNDAGILGAAYLGMQ